MVGPVSDWDAEAVSLEDDAAAELGAEWRSEGGEGGGEGTCSISGIADASEMVLNRRSTRCVRERRSMSCVRAVRHGGGEGEGGRIVIGD